jgi:hypothetical protein
MFEYKKVLFASAVTLTLAGATVLGVTQSKRPEVQPETLALIKQVESSQDQFLEIRGNQNCPATITEARVKEISSSLFTKLTGKATTLPLVCSFPDVQFANNSQKTVTGFVLMLRDAQTGELRMVTKRNQKLHSGELFQVPSNHFSGFESTVSENDGKKAQIKLAPYGFDSEKRWLSKTTRANLYVSILKVNFEDGSVWTANFDERGEVR